MEKMWVKYGKIVFWFFSLCKKLLENYGSCPLATIQKQFIHNLRHRLTIVYQQFFFQYFSHNFFSTRGRI